jgi:hypothetical protein
MTYRIYKTEYLLIAFFVILSLTLHVIADFNSFYHGDELLHIEAGRYPAFGYMDFAPVIAYMAYIQNIYQSDSLFINHLFVHIASVLILVFCGLSTMKLGGKWPAVLVTLSCILFSPGFGASHSLFLPSLFEQLAWVVCTYYLVGYCNSTNTKNLIWIGIFAALGFLTKYSIAFFIAGIVISAFLFQREMFKKKAVWLAVALFILIIIPNILWQFNNGLPVFNHVSKLYETQLDNNSRMEELKLLLLFLNPVSSLFWIAGLFVFPFIPENKTYRLASFSLLFAFILLFIAKGKTYYYFPIILGVLPLGAVFFERLLQHRKVILIGYISLLVLFGIVFLPKGVPILPLDKYVKLYKLKKNSDNKIPLTFENYYSKGIWKQVLKSVDSTYWNLPAAERKECLIWGRHYSQAGGINLLGRKYGLPPAISFHSSYYNWVPDFQCNITMIVISDYSWDKEHWLRYFNDVKEIETIENPYASDKEWYIQHIFLCRNLKYNSDVLKEKFRNQVF